MKRSRFFRQIALGAIGATVFQKQAAAAFFNSGIMSELFYTGSYTTTPQEGISVCRLDPDDGAMDLAGVCRGVENPSFLVYSQSRKVIYAANETADFGGKKSGSVSAFLRDEKTGMLTLLNVKPSLGAHPCHLTIDRTGKFILASNYTGGNVAVLSILPDGRLGEPADMVQHSGSGPDATRQEGPHAHSVNLSPDNRFAFVCDLGIDKIMIYRFDPITGKLSPAGKPFFQTAPGAGPRHFTFSKNDRNAFVINELNSTITSFEYNPANGILTELHTLSTLPADFTGENTGADIHVHPNGPFVYASNRGHDSIAVFSAEPGSGRLKPIQHQSTLGKTPRNFALHPSGRFLLAANQNSNSIQVFSVDPATGKLTETGKSISISKPVCILV